jgi:isochorismate hydrolase
MRKDAYRPRPSEWMSVLRPLMNERRRDGHEFSPAHSALLVTDMQLYFLDGSSHAFVPATESIVGNVRRIIDGFRSRSLPVVFTRHALMHDEEVGSMGRWWGDVLYEDDPLSGIAPDLAPLKEETVVRKTQYSAFAGTALDDLLRGRGVEQVVTTGVLTHLCCESTARDAFMRGYDVFFVMDGTASKTEDLHLASLKTLTEGFAMPVTTEEVLSWLRDRR